MTRASGQSRTSAVPSHAGLPTRPRRVLVAGIGNIFLGDDGFGVAVAQRLARRDLPEGVRVVDFGIRGFDLAFALLDGYDATILVDALARGGRPGTLYVLEPSPDESERLTPERAVDGHGLHPAKVLQFVRTLGGAPRGLVVLGCEPATLEGPGGQMGLSEPVQAAVDPAVELVESWIERLPGGLTPGPLPRRGHPGRGPGVRPPGRLTR